MMTAQMIHSETEATPLPQLGEIAENTKFTFSVPVATPSAGDKELKDIKDLSQNTQSLKRPKDHPDGPSPLNSPEKK